jgi:hypothetical protein
MMKTLTLAGALIVTTSGYALAQQTFSAWGHDFTVSQFADSDGSRPPIPTRSRPAFRFDVGHHSEMKPATR